MVNNAGSKNKYGWVPVMKNMKPPNSNSVVGPRLVEVRTGQT